MGVDKIKIFVYGSLRSGEYNYGRFGPQENLGEGVTPEGFVLVDLGAYPALVRKPYGMEAEGHVRGEIHEVTPDILAWLDMMEKGAGYHRASAEILHESGDAIKCEMYLMGWAHWMDKRIIPSGDWKNRK